MHPYEAIVECNISLSNVNLSGHICRNCAADTRGKTKIYITCEIVVYGIRCRLWGWRLSGRSKWWQPVLEGAICSVNLSLSVDFSCNSTAVYRHSLPSSDSANSLQFTSQKHKPKLNIFQYKHIPITSTHVAKLFCYNVPQTHNPLLLLTQPHQSRSPTVMHFPRPAYEPHAQIPRTHCPTGIPM